MNETVDIQNNYNTTVWTVDSNTLLETTETNEDILNNAKDTIKSIMSIDNTNLTIKNVNDLNKNLAIILSNELNENKKLQKDITKKNNNISLDYTAKDRNFANADNYRLSDKTYFLNNNDDTKCTTYKDIPTYRRIPFKRVSNKTEYFLFKREWEEDVTTKLTRVSLPNLTLNDIKSWNKILYNNDILTIKWWDDYKDIKLDNN